MFEHFRRHLLARGTTIASFGTADVDAFWQTPNGRTYSQATRMRYEAAGPAGRPQGVGRALCVDPEELLQRPS